MQINKLRLGDQGLGLADNEGGAPGTLTYSFKTRMS